MGRAGKSNEVVPSSLARRLARWRIVETFQSPITELAVIGEKKLRCQDREREKLRDSRNYGFFQLFSSLSYYCVVIIEDIV